MPPETGTTQEGVQGLGDEPSDGFGAFLTSFDDEDPKKKGAPSETNDEATETPETETSAEPEDKEGETEAEAEEETELGDDLDNAKVKIKVGDETKTVPLKDLKRLFGQEAALTQKSQKLAETARAVEAEGQRASIALKGMLDKANTRYAQYASWGPAEWSQLAAGIGTNMTVEDYNALRADAAAAKSDVDYLTQELDGHVKANQAKTQKAAHEAGIECVKVLQDASSAHHIPDFAQPLYDEMRTFTRSQGIEDQFIQLTSPAAVKVVHMAMLYAKQEAASKQAAVKVKKAVETAKRVIKPGPGRNDSTDKQRAAMKQQRERGGDQDSTEDAFLASFS